MTGAVDAATVVAELRAEVERRRAAGEYDERALRALHEEFGADLNEPPEAVAYIAASRPLLSSRAQLGPAIVFSKRVIRRLLNWYIAPIAEDQTRFNIASVRLLRKLEQRMSSIESVLGLADDVNRSESGSRPPGAAPTLPDVSGRLERLERVVGELSEQLANPPRH